MERPRVNVILSSTFAALLLLSCGLAQQQSSAGPWALTTEETRQLAKDAYICGFPITTNYQAMYKQALDPGNPDYRASFNDLTNSANVATPDDKFVVTPNSDTPYSYLWMDLRAEPVVVTMPKIDTKRYYSAQLIDLYILNFAYLGTRSSGNDGGAFMVAGPNRKGDTPKGLKAVLQSETEFAYVLFRTQLFNPADLANVKKIQLGYKAEPPAHAFWSLTMYDGKSQFLVANPSKRYLVNSTMLKSFKYGSAGSLTFYVQKSSPGVAKECNWLPASDGPFYAVLRVPVPAPEVVNRTWKKPAMQPSGPK